jgi:hypothetical protein
MRARRTPAARRDAHIVGAELVGVLAGDLARRAEPRRRTLLAGDVVAQLRHEPLARRRRDVARGQLVLELAQPAHVITASTAVANTRHSLRRSLRPRSPERVRL